MQLLKATDKLTKSQLQGNGFTSIYDLDGDGVIDDVEAVLRTQANDIYAWINEQ